jgi:hypothetical protein
MEYAETLVLEKGYVLSNVKTFPIGSFTREAYSNNIMKIIL